MNANRPIGVFDSGVGGLTVVKSLRNYLPFEDILYFGDTARVPYGNKSKGTVKRFSKEIMDFLVSKDVKFIVAACNTASSLAIPSLKKRYRIPVFGVVGAGAEEAKRVTKSGKVGVLGTVSTISSGAYDRELAKINKNIKVYSQSCPLFVPLVENGMIDDPVTLLMAKRYLKVLMTRDIDTLILGCTHYPLLRSVISRVLNGVNVVDSGFSVAKKTKFLLEKNKQLRMKRTRIGSIKCFVSDDVNNFSETARIFLREKMVVKKVVL